MAAAYASTLMEWKKTPAGSLEIDWSAVEERLGFELHSELKDLYSRVKGRSADIDGMVCFYPDRVWADALREKTGLGDGIDENGTEAEISLRAVTIADELHLRIFFLKAFIADRDLKFGRRAAIGILVLNGQELIYLVFNNDTGNFEWYLKEAEDISARPPDGIIADTAQGFLDSFTECERQE